MKRGWKISSHRRTFREWAPGGVVSTKLDTVEARKQVSGANILLVARSDSKTTMSMNGPLTLDPFFLHEVADIVGYIEDCRDKGIIY